MTKSVEIFRGKGASLTADAILKAVAVAARKAGDDVVETNVYKGKSDLLVLFGVGAEPHHVARNAQVQSGRHAIFFDLGYWERTKVTGYCRLSIDNDHCQFFLARTEPKPDRWDALGIKLRNDYDPKGPILLIGLGRKSRSYLREPSWEVKEFKRVQALHPGRRIIYRPKPGHPFPALPCEVNASSSIEALLAGASLVVCRHSNVAVDAVVAGVPFDAVDGAAMYIAGLPYTDEVRLDFLRRLAYWQYRNGEADQLWAFAKAMIYGQATLSGKNPTGIIVDEAWRF